MYTDRMLFRPPILYSKSAKINFAYGDVTFRPPDLEDWQKASAGLILPEGSTLKTGVDSKADLLFSDSMVVRLAENSELLVSLSNIKNKVIRLDKGSIYGHFKRQFEEQRIQIITPTAVANVRGTELGFEITEIDAPSAENPPQKADKEMGPPQKIPATTVYAISGIVDVKNPSIAESEILLSFQKQTLIGRDSPPSNPEKIAEDTSQTIREVLNSIHFEEVLLITDTLHFDTGSAKLRPESMMEVDLIVRLIRDRSEKIRIEGHTDDTGPTHVNQKLSVDRAETIRKLLIEKGVSEYRLFTEGYGPSRPIVPNNGEANRAKNRRVEFVIVE